MNTNEEQIETLEVLDTPQEIVPNDEQKEQTIVKPQPISVEELATKVAPTNLQNTNIASFGQEGIPLNNVNQNPKPSSLETVPKSDEYNNIGMVPPNAYIENTPKKNKKKFIFIIVTFVLVIAVGIFIYLYLGQGNKTPVNLKLKEVNIQVGEKISTNLNDYIEKGNFNVSNCMLNTESVLNNKIGNYKFKVICGNNTYTGDIHVVDSVVPIVETKYLIKKTNEEVKIEEFIESCVDASTCHYKYTDENKVIEAIKNTGTYEIIINVSDDYDNKIDVLTYLIVLNNDISHNLICNSDDIKLEDNKYSYKITDTIGLYSNSGFVYGNVSYRDYVLTFDDEASYNEVKALINNGYIELDNIKGKASFNDDDKTIKVEKLLTIEDLNAEFNSFPSSYSSIRNLYQNDSRKFSCSASKVN